jgi:uracil-DNA glycosylase
MSDKLKAHFGEGWYNLLADYLENPEFNILGNFIEDRRKAFNIQVYPKREDVFNAFKICPLEDLKVVVIGEGPYSTRDYANGLAYAYTGAGPVPPILNNIYREWENDVRDGLDLYFDYSLRGWAKQGVLFLNTALTVEENRPGSHRNEWRNFISFLFERLAEEKVGIVYVCWGDYSKSFIPLFNKHNTNLVIATAGPSPLTAHQGFFDSKPFSKINECLTEVAKGLEIDPEDYIIKW